MGNGPSTFKFASDQIYSLLTHYSGREMSVDNSFLNFFDNPISDDLLIDILSHVPYKDLISHCQLVCRRWKDIIDGQTIWRQKCEHENIKIPNLSHRLLEHPEHYYRFLYLYSKSRKNLLKNPFGEENLSGWEVLRSGGDGLAIENPPDGADPVPVAAGSRRCFATSYGHCQKFQIIDLYKERHNKYLLQNKLAVIKIGEWYAARFDCGCVYALKVILLDENSKVVDEFAFEFRFEQWEGGPWQMVEHEFLDVSKVRYVKFEHMGCDTQFWAGHYALLDIEVLDAARAKQGREAGKRKCITRYIGKKYRSTA